MVDLRTQVEPFLSPQTVSDRSQKTPGVSPAWVRRRMASLGRIGGSISTGYACEWFVISEAGTHDRKLVPSGRYPSYSLQRIRGARAHRLDRRRRGYVPPDVGWRTRKVFVANLGMEKIIAAFIQELAVGSHSARKRAAHGGPSSIKTELRATIRSQIPRLPREARECTWSSCSCAPTRAVG